MARSSCFMSSLTTMFSSRRATAGSSNIFIRTNAFILKQFVVSLSILVAYYPKNSYSLLLATNHNNNFHANFQSQRLPNNNNDNNNNNNKATVTTIPEIHSKTFKSKTASTSSSSKRLMSSMSGNNNNPSTTSAPIRHIHMKEMEDIVDDYETNDTTEYIVIDVRTDEEVIYSGKISPSVYTLPIQVIGQYNVFALDNDDFEEICGFVKPELDQTIVFTCKSGIRSVYACQYASQSGYSKLINYVGGSSEWFTYHRNDPQQQKEDE